MKEKTNFINPSVFSDRLKSAQKERGMTCEELAELLDVHPTTIPTWRNGKNLPSLDMAAGIAEIFGVSIDYLCGRCEEA